MYQSLLLVRGENLKRMVLVEDAFYAAKSMQNDDGRRFLFLDGAHDRAEQSDKR